MASTASFKQQCPSCETLVPIRDPALVGRKIDCPKCKYRFLVEEPTDEPNEDEDEGITSKPAKKPRSAAVTDKKPADKSTATTEKKPAKAKVGKPARKAEAKSKTPLIIGGVLALVAVVGLIVAAVIIFGGSKGKSTTPAPKKPGDSGSSGKDTKDSKGKDKDKGGPNSGGPSGPVAGRKVVEDITNLLPPDTQAVVEVPSVEALLNSSLRPAVFETPGAFQPEKFQRLFGFGPDRVGRLVVGVNSNDNWVFTVLRLKNPLEAKEKAQMKDVLALEDKGSLRGHPYMLVRRPLDSLGNLILKGNQPRSLFLNVVDDYTLVFADEQPLRRLLEVDYLFPHHKTAEPPPPPPPAAPEKQPMPKTSDSSQSGSKPRPMPPTGTPSTSTPMGTPPMPIGTPPMPNGPPPAGEAGKPKPPETVEVGTSYLTVDPAFKGFLDQVRGKGDTLLLIAEDPRLILLRVAGPPLLAETGPNGRNWFDPKDYNKDVVRIGLRLEVLDQEKYVARLAVEFIDAGQAKTKKEDLEARLGLGAAALPAPGDPRPGTPNTPPGMPNPMPGRPLGPIPPKLGGGPGPMGPMGPTGPGAKPPPPPPPATGPLTFSVVKTTLLAKVNEPLDPSSYQRKKVLISNLAIFLKGEAEMVDARSRIHLLVRAMEGYVKQNQQFPRGTAQRPKPEGRPVPWGPDQRISWMAELLPFLGDSAIPLPEVDKSWNEGKNLFLAQTVVPAFVVPPTHRLRYPTMAGPVGATHFVGVAGVGLDAASYPAGNPKAGVFGYDRVTRLEQLKNPAQTIVLLQVPPDQRAPWLAGGGSTVRGIAEGDDCLEPYILDDHAKQPGTYALMADFKVRFIPRTIDKDKFRAMCQLDGARIDDLDAIAPLVKLPADEDDLPPVDNPMAEPAPATPEPGK